MSKAQLKDRCPRRSRMGISTMPLPLVITSRKHTFKLGFCVSFLGGLSMVFMLFIQTLSKPKWVILFPKATKNSTSINAGQENLTEQDMIIVKDLLLTQKHSWEPNASEVAQFRAELGECCNASFWLVLTKENTPLGSTIKFDGENATSPADAYLRNLLPKRSPFLGHRYRTCAVVGNGGILRHSHCGKEIDQADLVIRFNMAPMNFCKDVGNKTNLMSINPSILLKRMRNLKIYQEPFPDSLRPYGDALLLIPAFSFRNDLNIFRSNLSIMENFGLKQQPLFLSPQYLGNLSNYWKKRGLRPRRLSSGFIFVSVAFEFCQRITLYGFSPLPYDIDGHPVPHHYYDNVPPKAGVHNMYKEFSYFLRMYTQDLLRLQVGKCH